MEPTVGRNVHYRPDLAEVLVWPALITKVLATGVVHLTAFPDPDHIPRGTHGATPAVVVRDVPQADEAQMIVDGLDQPAHSWRWPPRS